MKIPRPPEWPSPSVDVVIDTDAANEIDDPFAIAYALLSPERMRVQAIYATPFHNDRSTGPADGMEQSHAAILQLLECLGREPDGWVFRGARAWMPDALTAVSCPAVSDLIQRAREREPGAPLYVLAIGALTHVASALVAAPDLRDRIVVLWLGGHPLSWPSMDEFNLQGDLTASRVVFGSGVPLVRFPCRHVAEALQTTLPELDRHLRPHGALGAYLTDLLARYERIDARAPGASRPIWDLAPVAWLVNAATAETRVQPTPRLSAKPTWEVDSTQPLMREATWIDRVAVYRDFFTKVAAFARADPTADPDTPARTARPG